MKMFFTLCKKSEVFAVYALTFLLTASAYGSDVAGQYAPSRVSQADAPSVAQGSTLVTHAVFTMTNASTGNRVVEFSRNANNTLTLQGSYATGGRGSGSGLENQGAIALALSNKFLLVVNARSNSVSALGITSSGLVLTSQVSSGGRLPISVTVHGNLVYVLNAGGRLGGTGVDNISGFRLSSVGKLTQIANSTARLAAANTNPAQIGFRPDGTGLVVTEHGGQLIDLFTVNGSGLPSAHRVQSSAGRGPFGFAFRNNSQLLVSEADNGTSSSYSADTQGDLHLVTGAVSTGQWFTCWLAIAPNRVYAYVTNTGSGTISKYRVATDGSISLSTAVSARTQGGPLDLTVSPGGNSLFTLTTTGRIQVFQVGTTTGNLTLLQTLQGLPAGGSGLVSF